ncbi:MAG: HisA/HisF-related TIM barrel protein, partial [Candidatus Omnitrophota bacterium]
EIIKRVRLKIEVGGGVRSTETIRKYLEVGVDRVVLSTRIIEDTSFLLSQKIRDYVDRIVTSIDIKHMVDDETATTATVGWLKCGDALIDIPSLVGLLTKAGIGYLNFSDISRDGMLEGLDVPKILNFVKLVKKITQGKLFLTYAGGVSCLEDIVVLKSLEKEGLGAVVVGRALYENKFTLKDAIQAAGNSAA